MKRLKEAILLLTAHDAPLGPEWLDHALAGDWADNRECHVGGDFLFIYRLDVRPSSCLTACAKSSRPAANTCSRTDSIPVGKWPIAA